MTPLGREIAAMIEAEGPMRLDRYMALCLSHPRHGYYATRDPFGARGDFVTAPEISQMFGELIGLWCAEVWRMMGSPSRVRLIELGPGRGTLMADLLRAAKAAAGFVDAVEIVLVETSPLLRDVQASKLKHADAAIRWAATVEDALWLNRHPGHSAAESRDRAQNEAPLHLSRAGRGRPAWPGEGVSSYLPPHPLGSASRPPPAGVGWTAPYPENDPGSTADAAVRDDDRHAGTDPAPVLLIANEFFDALPIRQFVATEHGWRERLVGLGPDGALALGLAPEPPADVRLPDAAMGEVCELRPQAQQITGAIAAYVATHGGAALAIDYGYLAGHGDTFQALRGHTFANPLATPGEADLTAHVDFAALASAGARGGAAVMAPLAQAEFLGRLGLAARADALARARPDLREAIQAAAARLTDRTPRGIGALFKALAFGDPRLGPLPGFEAAAYSRASHPKEN